jgi:hypothetical protein
MFTHFLNKCLRLHMLTHMFTPMFLHIFTHMLTHMFTHVYTNDYTHIYTQEKENLTQRHRPSQPSAHICACLYFTLVVFHFCFLGCLPFCWGCLPFSFFEIFILIFKKKLMLSSIFLGHLSSWVKIRLHTENQLPVLSGSALTVSLVVGWVGWCQILDGSCCTLW